LRAERTGEFSALFPARHLAPSGLEASSLLEGDTDRDCALIQHRTPAVPFERVGELSSCRRQRFYPERFGGESWVGSCVSAALAPTKPSRGRARLGIYRVDTP